MIKIGTYNALIGESEYYAASRIMDSVDSHKVFRGCLRSGFAWECLDVYSGPPRVAFKWRHVCPFCFYLFHFISKLLSLFFFLYASGVR